MKKITALLLGITMILTHNITALAIGSDDVSPIILSEESYSGSKADFLITISQEKSTDSIKRKSIGNTVDFEETNLGIKGILTITERPGNSMITIQFTDDINNQIQVEEDNSLIFFNGQGIMIGAADTLDIKDATGNTIDVTINAVEESVDYIINDDNAVYPLSGEISIYGVDDFSQWFSSGQWLNRGGDISLNLKHTGWAYVGMSTGPISWSWNTIKAKFSSSSNWYNETGLRDQYYCHANFASGKAEWNIEAWRPNVGYTSTILAECNP